MVIGICIAMSIPKAVSQQASPSQVMVKEEPRQSISLASRLISTPLGVAGIFWGVTAGIPVKVAKTILSESKRMYGTLLDDFGGETNLANSTLALSLGVPYGIVSGIILGSIKGTEQGLRFGYEKPFSLQSISLAEPEE